MMSKTPNATSVTAVEKVTAISPGVNVEFRLVRDRHAKDGIFGRLLDKDSNEVAVTLEHAYERNLATPPSEAGKIYMPKLGKGTYRCERGEHQLANGPKFITFEIMGVPGHYGILFHAGNYNADSSGCVLLGRRIAPMANGDEMITSSKNTFLKFMDLVKDVNEFTLIVS